MYPKGNGLARFPVGGGGVGLGEGGESSSYRLQPDVVNPVMFIFVFVSCGFSGCSEQRGLGSRKQTCCVFTY